VTDFGWGLMPTGRRELQQRIDLGRGDQGDINAMIFQEDRSAIEEIRAAIDLHISGEANPKYQKGFKFSRNSSCRSQPETLAEVHSFDVYHRNRDGNGWNFSLKKSGEATIVLYKEGLCYGMPPARKNCTSRHLSTKNNDQIWRDFEEMVLRPQLWSKGEPPVHSDWTIYHLGVWYQNLGCFCVRHLPFRYGSKPPCEPDSVRDFLSSLSRKM
jgi:hypothetical protein